MLAAAFTAAAIVAWVTTPADGSSDVGALVALITWGAAIAFAFALNPMYLRWHWRRDGNCRCGAHFSAGWSFTTDPSANPRANAPEREGAPANAAHNEQMFVIQDVRPARQGIRSPERPAASSANGSTDHAESPGPGQSTPSGQTHEPPPIYEQAPKEAAVSLGEAVVMSAVYRQHAAVVRVVFDDGQLASVINRMAAARGARLGAGEMALALGVPIARVHGGVSCLARQLNIDGYPVVSREGDLTVLDIDVLREQFGV